jgi:hypothetical protein
MNFRLGEYQCSSCDYSEVPAPPKPESTRGESISRRQPWQPTVGSNLPSGGRQYTGAPQPWQPTPREAAPPSAYGGMTEPVAPLTPQPSMFAAPSWEALPYVPTQVKTVERSPSLQVEKHICFGLYVLCVAITVAFIVFLMGLANSPSFGPEMGQAFQHAGSSAPGEAAAPPVSGEEMRAVMGFVMIFWVMACLAGVLLNWWAFYGTTIWAKWCCMGCIGVGILICIAGMFQVFAASMLLTQGSLPMPGPARGFLFILVVVNLAYQVWAISILYRDVQELQYR